MTSDTASKMIAAIDSIMVDGDFTRVEGPLGVGNVTFEVPRAYVSGPGFLDLVVVIDLTDGTGHQLKHGYWLVERIASALDQARSPMTLTSVVLHDAAAARVPTEDFLRHGRVLLVTDAARVKAELAPILPIVLTPSGDLAGDPLAGLLPTNATGEDAQRKTDLVEAARIGTESVEASFVDWIEDAFHSRRRTRG